MFLRKAGLAIAWLIASAVPGFAQFSDMLQRYQPPPKGTSDTYIVTLSGTGGVEPRYPGSDRATGTFFPSLSYRRLDEPARYGAVDDGASFSIVDTPTVRFGPVFRYEAGRYLSDDRRLVGLRKLNWDIESGLFLEYWPVNFLRVRVEGRHGFHDDSGFAGTLGIDAVVPYDRFVFSLGPRIYLGDTRYVNRYFGVRGFEAAPNPRLFPYRPEGGLTGVGGLGSVTYQWNDTWATTAFVGYQRLVRDAAASPIVSRIGSVDQFTIGVKLSYSFSYTP